MPAPEQDASVPRLERHLAELQGLIRVVGQINRSLDLNQVLDSTIAGIRQVLGGGFGCFVLIDPVSHRLELAHPSELPPTIHEQLQTLVRDFGASNAIPEASLLLEISSRLRGIDQSQDWVTFIPLTAQERPIGVLMVAIERGRLLTPPGVDILMSIGEQVGMAIENARLHAAVRESEEWNRTFIENSLDGFWEGELTGQITYVNQAACNIMEYERAELLAMGPTLFSLDVKDAQRVGEQLQRNGFVVGHQTDVGTKNGQIKTVSYSVRLVNNKEGKPTRFQAIFRDISEQKRLLEMLRRRNEELSALNSIGSILNHPLEIASALNLVCDQIATMLGMESVAICLVDETRTQLRLIAHHGIEEPLLSAVREVGLDDPMARAIAIDGQTFAMNDLTRFKAAGFAAPRQAGYHAGIAIPIQRRGQGAGAIFVGSKSRFKYEPSNVALIGNIAERVGMALENATLYLEMQRRVNELDGLAHLSAAFATSLDPAGICNLTAEWTRRLLNADSCSVRLIRGEMMSLGAAQGLSHGVPVSPQVEMQGPALDIIRDQLPLAIEDVEKDSRMSREQRERSLAHHGRSLLAVALRTPDKIIGVLTVGHTHTHAWQQNEIDLLQTIANESANSIHNAQLYQDVLSEQRKVQAIFDSGISGLFATDAQGRIVMFNRAAERITGWSKNEVQGKQWEEIFADESTAALSDSLINEALVRKKTAYVPDGRKIRTRYGTFIPVAKAVAPLVDEKDQVTGAVGAFWDLTREKEAEMDYARFLSEVAHQICNPLTTIISGLELLEKPRLSSKHKAELRALVRSQGERLKTYSQQFLAHQKTVHSAEPLECEDLYISNIIERLVSEFRVTYPCYSFVVHCPDGALQVNADPFRLDNILRNLLDNAIAYSPEGSQVALAVTCIENGGRVDIAVQDKGYGIPISQQEHIFEAFFRASHAETRRLYGHGLGLFIARQMAREMGGTIDFESRENEGSTFHLILRRTA